MRNRVLGWLIAIVAIGLVGVGIWFVKNKNAGELPIIQTQQPSNLKAYTNGKYGYSLSYPDTSASTPDEKSFGNNCTFFPLEPLKANFEVCHSNIHPYFNLSDGEPLIDWLKGNPFFIERVDANYVKDIKYSIINVPGAKQAVRASYTINENVGYASNGDYDNIFLTNGDDLFWIEYRAINNGAPPLYANEVKGPSLIPQQILDSWKFISPTNPAKVVDVFPVIDFLPVNGTWIVKSDPLIDTYGKDSSTIKPALLTMTKNQLGIDPSYEFGGSAPARVANLQDGRKLFVVAGVGPGQSADIAVAAYDFSANKVYLLKELFEGGNIQIYGTTKQDLFVEAVLLNFYSCYIPGKDSIKDPSWCANWIY